MSNQLLSGSFWGCEACVEWESKTRKCYGVFLTIIREGNGNIHELQISGERDRRGASGGVGRQGQCQPVKTGAPSAYSAEPGSRPSPPAPPARCTDAHPRNVESHAPPDQRHRHNHAKTSQVSAVVGRCYSGDGKGAQTAHSLLTWAPISDNFTDTSSTPRCRTASHAEKVFITCRAMHNQSQCLCDRRRHVGDLGKRGKQR
jgi:hypothetical protein